jgi:hypothetical protein
MICIALRDFKTRGVEIAKDAPVDTSDWPVLNVNAMISQRWLRKATSDDLKGTEFDGATEPAAEEKAERRRAGRPRKEEVNHAESAV